MTKSIVKNQIEFDDKTVDLIKHTVAEGSTDEELKLFLYQAKRTGLDPLARQIYFIKRGGKVVIQTSIDGFRVVANRAGDYAGQDEPEFEEGTSYPKKCVVTVHRFSPKGERYPAAHGVAYWSEYCPPEGQNFMWKKMPHAMLAKVAEALALRKAFPQDLSGLYTDEEMEQSVEDVKTTTPAPIQSTTKPPVEEGTVIAPDKPKQPLITDFQRKKIFALGALIGHEPDETSNIIKKHYKLDSLNDLTLQEASKIIEKLMAKSKDTKKEEPMVENVDPDEIPL